MKPAQLALFFILGLTGCVMHSQNVYQRFEYWQQEAAQIPEGASRKDVEAWAAAHELKDFSGGYSGKPAKDRLVYAAERVTVHGLITICDNWTMMVEFDFDADKRVTKHTVTELGACL